MNQFTDKPTRAKEKHKQIDSFENASKIDFKSSLTQEGIEIEISKPPVVKIETRPIERLKKLFAPIIKIWAKQNLGTKARIIAICLGVMPVVIVGGNASNYARQSMKESIIIEQEGRTADLANEVSIFIQGILDNTKAIASSPMLVDPTLNQTASTTQKIALLDSVIDASQVKYKNIAVFDNNGNLLFQSSPQANGQKITNVRKFRKIIALVNENKTPSIDTLRDDSITSIVSAAPIAEKPTGEIIGYIVTRIDIDSLKSLFNNIVAQNWEYKIIGNNKKIFIADETEYIGKYAKEDLANFDILYKKIANSKEKESKYSSEIATELLLDIGEENNRKERVLVSYTRIDRLDNIIQNSWGLIVSRPSKEAFAPVAELRNFLFVGVLLAATIVGYIATIFARKAIKPIVLAAGAVEKIGRGEFNTRLKISGSDERAVLCDNINNMAEELQLLIEDQAISISQSRFLVQITSTPVFDRLQLQNLFSKVTVGIRKILQLERTLIYRFEKDGSATIICESVLAPYKSLLNQKISKLSMPKTVLAEYKRGRVLANQDVNRANFHLEYVQLMKDWEVKSNLIAPIFKQGQLYGLLIAHHCQDTHSWHTREINFIKQVAAQLGVTLDRIGLLEARGQEAKRSELLKNITFKLASSLNPESIYQTAAAQLQESLNSDRAIVVNWKQAKRNQIIAEKFNKNIEPIGKNTLIIPDTEDELARELYKQGEVREIANVSTTTNLTVADRRELESLSVKAYLVAPILVSGELDSFCIVHQCDRPRDWGKSDIDLIYQVATQVGVALERSNLLEQQKIAKELLQNRAVQLLAEVDPVSSGNLTVSANVTQDEIGTIADFYNSTVESLRQLVTQVKTSSEQVAIVTKINQTAVQDLAWGARQQSADIEAAMNRISRMSNATAQVARNAEKASIAVQKSSVTVVEGETAMNRMVDGFEGIRETVAKTSKKIKRLGESSQKISKVVNLIGTFAEQTNLLALNASIEAAHAGEQGKGFAVVAEEVRALSQQSAQATAEIEKIVASIQAETNEVVAAMEEGTARVVEGTWLVGETRSSLEKIALASVQINQLVLAIAEATAIQSQEEEAVSETIAEVADISQQTSADASSVSASFEELLTVAQKLQESVNRFKVE